MCAWPMAMFLRTRRRWRPRAAVFRGGATLRLRRRLLAAAHGLRRALARPRVRPRALPVDGQAAAMTDSTVRADLAEALDRLRALAAQISFDLKVLVDVLTELRDFVVGEVANLRVGVEPELGGDLLRGRLADPVDVREPDLESLLVGEVHSRDACHRLTLPLLVSGVGADDHGLAVPLDHAAALAHGLD